MASRDNQTLQIFVIVLSLVSIGLFVGVILLNNSKKAAQAAAEQAKSDAQNARNAANDAQAEANSYKQWMGYDEGDSLDTLQQSFTEDMQRYGSTFDESNRFYRTILGNIFEENRKLAANELAAKLQVKELEQRLGAAEQEKQDEIKAVRKLLDDVEQTAASERNEFNTQRQALIEEKTALAGDLAGLRQEIDTMRAEHQAAIDALNQQVADQKRLIRVLQSSIPSENEFAQPSDGSITWVSQRQRNVWVNLGSADFLQPHTTFSVYGANENNVVTAEKKGTIEITRILGPHSAEGRITSDDARKPLMPGDQLFSQVWDRGRQLGFGIAGIIDLDGDGKNDIDEVLRIIRASGGKIDASANADAAAGEPAVDGAMTIRTRYLILGDLPTAARHVAERTAWDELSAAADTLNIETIPVDRFLELIGWQPPGRTVALGDSARAADFPPESETGIQTQSPSDLFRRRTPPPSY